MSWGDENPLGNSAFRTLFVAQVVSLIGTGLSTVALALLAYDLADTDAALVLGNALAIKMIAYVVFSPIAGGLANRFERRSFLVVLNLSRAVAIALMPFATNVWQIYLLIFLLNLLSAAYTPIFTAVIPDILPEERQYTRALSMSRLAYDLETLLSPLLAAAALLMFSYSGLFAGNALAFIASAGLVWITTLPAINQSSRSGSTWNQISFGIISFLKTPRLRGLLSLYVGVAAASAMLIVNTVIYVMDNLGGTESDVAFAMAAAGGGSMVAALALPKVLDRMDDRPVMLAGALLMALGLGCLAAGPSGKAIWLVWFVTGAGWSLIQTPAGRLVNRSTTAADRSAYFSAQFALSHACWLAFYPMAGYLGSWFGVETTALIFAAIVVASAGLAAFLWPRKDSIELLHTHPAVNHEHLHFHDRHHQHEHEGWEGPEPHSHRHFHRSKTHRHPFVIDDHHSTWPQSS